MMDCNWFLTVMQKVFKTSGRRPQRYGSVDRLQPGRFSDPSTDCAQ
jgi:predicted acyl esterase